MATVTSHKPVSTEAAPAESSARFADPGPLGLAGFALTTFVLSVFNAGLVGAGAEGVVLGLALFYGGLVQLLAGMWEFVKGNTFGAVAFASYGGFWMSFWYLVGHTDLSKATPNDVNHGLGVYLLAWTIFTLYMFVASARTSGAIMAVFGVLTVTFLFLAIGKFANSDGITKFGGWLGLITAALAWYGSFAAVTNSTYKRVVLPVFPR
jgi:succinate-acetate transporter protein